MESKLTTGDNGDCESRFIVEPFPEGVHFPLRRCVHAIEVFFARHGGQDHAFGRVGDLEKGGWWGRGASGGHILCGNEPGIG